ncbi:hypothetical protein [Duganella fentianensis]|uniref:hypothetical protein n=1 Tax=Duganella fentianensis TaxID=2692177 RepID=UPI0032B22135
MTTAVPAYLPITEAPAAATNIWRIPLSDQVLVEKLLELDTGPIHIDYLCRDIPRTKGEVTEQYFARVHVEARKILRKKLELSANAIIRYEFLRVDSMFYFFFLSDKAPADSNLYGSLLAADVPSHRLVQALIGLHVKIGLLDQVAQEFEIDNVYYNAALYLGTDVYPRKKDGRVLIDTFEARFYYSTNNELVTTLHNQTFLATPASTLQAAVEETVMTIRTQENVYVASEKLDARQYGRKKFMRFQRGYRGCQNHAHTLVARCVTRLFDRIQVDAVRDSFQATAIWDEFVTAAANVSVSKTIIVDNYGPYPSDAARDSVHGQLRKALAPCEIVPATTLNSYDSLSDENCYVFINKSVGRNGSSIVDAITGKQFNTFWQAYGIHKQDKNCSFDLYTRMKIAHFTGTRNVVMQGIDLPEQLSAHDESPISSHVLLKVRKELWLKQSVLQRKAISGLSQMPTGSYRLVYVRKPENMFFASTLSCRFADGTLSLDDQLTFGSEDELLFAFPMLRPLEKLYDGSFYLYDCATRVLLTSYTSARVPQILGNVAFDNVKKFHEAGDTLRKLTAPQENPLPYYVTPRLREQYHHIFLQEKGPDLRYFVSPKGNPQSVFSAQCRTYNILTWDEYGSPVKQIEQPVTSMFLRSFTDDIVLNGQVSKSSLLVKAARLFLEN